MFDDLRADIAADLTDYDASGATRIALVLFRMLFTARLQAVVLLRIEQALGRRLPAAAIVVKWLNGVLTGSDVAWQAEIGPGLQLYHPAGVVVGPSVVIGPGCTLMQHVTLGHDRGGSPRLGARVSIGPGACVLGPIEIGEDSRVGANSVLTRDLPVGAVAFGNPARVRGTTLADDDPRAAAARAAVAASASSGGSRASGAP